MLKLKNPKILIRPSQAKSTKGINVVIGEERLEKKMLQNKTSRAAMKTSILVGHGKEKKTGSKLTGQTGSSSGLTSPQGGLTGVQTSLTGASSKSRNSSMTEFRRRPSFKELLAKYEKEKVVQRQKE